MAELVRFLDGEAATKEIARLAAYSGRIRIAVAFWGEGAMEGLGLKGRPAEIVCNLKSGGTNPHEIKKLMGQVRSVRQCDTLHGKVYLFDDRVVLGSSNASANGLALQGNELAGWREANIVTTDRAVYEAAEKWMDRLKKRDIGEDDLKEAEIAFRNRRSGPRPQEKQATPQVRYRDPLDELDSSWRALGIVPEFKQVHHSVLPNFAVKRPRLDRFIEHCGRRNIKEQNIQTLKRALDVARRMRDGARLEEALEQAWANYPVVTRQRGGDSPSS